MLVYLIIGAACHFALAPAARNVPWSKRWLPFAIDCVFWPFAVAIALVLGAKKVREINIKTNAPKHAGNVYTFKKAPE